MKGEGERVERDLKQRAGTVDQLVDLSSKREVKRTHNLREVVRLPVVVVSDHSSTRANSTHQPNESRDLNRPPSLLCFDVVHRRSEDADRVLWETLWLVRVESEEFAKTQREGSEGVELRSDGGENQG